MTKTKARIHRITGTPAGDVWVWKCGRPRCLEWTHTPNISVAPRGIGYGATWDQAARGLLQHMTNEHPRRPGVIYIPSERTWRRPTLLAASVGMVLGVVALVLSLLAMSDDPASPSPSPTPPLPTSSEWSEECTAEDLDDGMCLTWDDIRDLEWHTQRP